ncbi:MAG: argininosuccinate lyase [Alphaproteobacteria bacterium]|nr:argininosuccinate lyase [Alphaproteobacteria bacterium]
MTIRDDSVFPSPVYKRTVLAPLFDGAKRHFLESFRRIDRAHCTMLAETGILPRDTAAAIARALVAIERELEVDKLVYDGSVEDFFFLIEGELRRRLGPDVAGRLHTGRSRNDMDHTNFRIVLKQRLDGLGAKAAALAEAMIATARRERDTLIVAYTHGQPAQPSTFGHYLGAAIEVLLRDLDRLAAAREVVDRCPMGAAAITTSGFPLDRHRMAELLGFAAPLENSYGCIASVDYVTAPYSAIRLLMLHLGRLLQDMQFWSSFEVGQLYVPNAFVQISSIMPQKRNPVPIEHMRLLASLAAGKADALVTTMHNTPFTDMNDSEGAVQEAGYPAIETAERVLELLAAFLAAVRIDAARVRRNTDASCNTITELADTLVREEGLSFRQAHEIAAHVARAVTAAGGSLTSAGHAPFLAAFHETTGRAPRLDAAGFAAAVSPERFVAVRNRHGGPAPEALDAAFDGYAAHLARLRAGAAAITTREAGSAATLDAAFGALLKA